MRQRQLNILILYVANRYPMRTTLWDQLYSFRRYSDHNCFYLNLTLRQLPWYLKKIKFDLIVFGTLFMASRVDDKWFDPPREKARGLNSFAAAKIAFPQDEYLCTDVLSDFINEFGIDCVFSVAPESEWPKIYEGIDTTKVKERVCWIAMAQFSGRQRSTWRATLTRLSMKLSGPVFLDSTAACDTSPFRPDTWRPAPPELARFSLKENITES